MIADEDKDLFPLHCSGVAVGAWRRNKAVYIVMTYEYSAIWNCVCVFAEH